VIDLFGGPGGLNEAFSRFAPTGDAASFRVAASFEMDPVACRTLTSGAAVCASLETPASRAATGTSSGVASNVL